MEFAASWKPFMKSNASASATSSASVRNAASTVLGTAGPASGPTQERTGVDTADRLLPTVLIVEDDPVARRFYASPEYQAIIGIRHQAATSRLVLVEGYAPAT